MTDINGGLTDMGLTACEREVVAAMAAWRRRTGKEHATWADFLEVLQSLGYGVEADAA